MFKNGKLYGDIHGFKILHFIFWHYNMQMFKKNNAEARSQILKLDYFL
jgi:hypothetical protein